MPNQLKTTIAFCTTDKLGLCRVFLRFRSVKKDDLCVLAPVLRLYYAKGGPFQEWGLSLLRRFVGLHGLRADTR